MRRSAWRTTILERPLQLAMLALFVLTWCRPAAADPPSSPGQLLEVADLNDVFFVDAERGWAVGDRGVIWYTRNGGRHWDLAESPTTARLNAIHFVDENHGWIVGGFTQPLTHDTVAVVLRTTNGGRRWTRIDVPTLPALKWVHFHSPREGWAVGRTSAMYPLGIFRTDDGGLAWHSLPLAEQRSMRTAAVRDGRRLVIVDHESLSWLLDGERLTPIGKPELGLREIRSVAMSGSHGWMVGTGGAVLVSPDGGRSWQPPARPVPGDLAHEFDWNSVAVHGPRCWVVGSPGTRILHSPDGGASWQAFSTGQPLPLRRVWFLDEFHGWAVGTAGSILFTHDGGRSWRVQRQGATRAGVAGMFALPDNVPWEILAQTAADEGHYTVLQLLTRPLPPPGAADASIEHLEDRLCEAATAIGASCQTDAWPFPVRDAELPLDQLAESWDAGRHPDRLQRFEESMVRQIRTWRPDIILADPIVSGGRPLDHAACQAVMRAAQIAGDPSAYSHQLTIAGLEPWAPKKVFTRMPDGQRGTARFDAHRLGIHLGCTLAQFSMISRGLLASTAAPAPDRHELRLVHSTLTHEAAPRELFGGLMPGAVGESRRPNVPYAGVHLNSLGSALEKQQQLHQLLGQMGRQAQPADVQFPWDELLANLSPHHGGLVLHELAQTLATQGQYARAAESMHQLVHRYPDHLFASHACLWLLRYFGSAEWQRAFPAADTMPSGPARRLAPSLAPANDVQLASSRSPLPDTPHAMLDPSQPLAQALHIGGLIQQTQLHLNQSPTVRLLLASIHRRLGNMAEAERLVNSLTSDVTPFSWQSCARSELAFLRATGRPVRPVLECPPTATKPVLDGTLEDPIWQTAASIELKTWSNEPLPSARVQLAYDTEYLYLAVRCPQGASHDSLVTEPRQRDQPLGRQDRIEIAFDVERDYASSFRFVIDRRGWAVDACGSERQWNPRWHVAAASDTEQWTAEAAIPLNELETVPTLPRQPWGLSVRRVQPSGQVQSWAPSRSSELQFEDCGYLVFR